MAPLPVACSRPFPLWAMPPEDANPRRQSSVVDHGVEPQESGQVKIWQEPYHRGVEILGAGGTVCATAWPHSDLRRSGSAVLRPL